MSDAPIRFHPDAVTEVEFALDWYARRSHRAAEWFEHEFETAVGLVAEAPARWPKFGNDARRVRLGRFPYFLIYRYNAGVVEVFALAHGRRRPGYWRERMSG